MSARRCTAQRTLSASGDGQLADVVIDGVPDHQVALQYRDGFGNQIDGLRCGGRIGFNQKIGQTFEIGRRTP